METLFIETLQDTSPGDIGLKCGADGPIFRVHSAALATTGGIISKLRCNYKSLPLDVKFPSHFDYYTNLLLDSNSAKSAHSKFVYKELKASHLPGQAHLNDSLKEIYALPFPYEYLYELVRFIYKRKISYTGNTVGQMDVERKETARAMKELFMMSDKLSVDPLFEYCMSWFETASYNECGATAFADIFYTMEHYSVSMQEAMYKDKVRQTMVNLGHIRPQLKAIYRDIRWPSISDSLLFQILSHDDLAVAQETDVINLIEKWNAQADKTKDAVARVRSCLRTFGNLRNNHDLKSDETSQADVGPLHTSGGGSSGRNKEDEEDEKEEQVFVLLSNNGPVSTGSSINMKRGQNIAQQSAFRLPGVYKARVAMKQLDRENWPEDQRIFIGANYGKANFLGFLLKKTEFLGIYNVGVVSKDGADLEKQVHITGSGNRVELDFEMEIKMPRVDGVVVVNCGLYFNNNSVCSDSVYVQEDVLSHGPGLRLMITGNGLKELDNVSTQITWLETRHVNMYY
jgi:BTB And C-terminal Kelch